MILNLGRDEEGRVKFGHRRNQEHVQRMKKKRNEGHNVERLDKKLSSGY